MNSEASLIHAGDGANTGGVDTAGGGALDNRGATENGEKTITE